MRLVAFVASLAALAAPSITFGLAPQAQGLSDQTLRVIRTSPANDASPATVISVTFDRPVAGSLDNTVDPKTVLSVQPPIAGKVEWRDPVTIRLTPATPLASGASYTVSVSNAFQAMDGSRLTTPHSFTFRVQGPTLLTGAPIGEGAPYALHMLPNQRIELVYSAPVDLAALTASVYAEFSAGCASGPRQIVRYRAVSQRPVAQTDPGRYRYAVSRRAARGERRGEDVRGPDTLRRVVLLQPTSPMPYGCSAELVAPAEVGTNLPPDYVRTAFSTHGALQLSAVSCAYGNEFCASGPLTVLFTNPVKGAQVERYLTLYPATPFTVRDTSAEAVSWVLDTKLIPRTNYAIAVDTALRDVFGQRITGNPARGFATTGYYPTVGYAFGKQLVERVGLRTLAVQHTNVDTLVAIVAAVPDSLEAQVLATSWGGEDIWTNIFASATRRTIPVRSAPDLPLFTGVPLPGDGVAPATVYAVRVTGRSGGRPAVSDGPVSIVQVTDLGVHARIGKTEGTVWVTSVNTGAAKTGASVTLYDAKGQLLARGTTDARGLARLTGWSPNPSDQGDDSFEGYIKVSSVDDRAVASLTSWDPDLSPWRFNVYSAYGDDRYPLSGTVFTERGIYRPGEKVYAKAIIRHGLLGALRAPARDSVQWIFRDREDGVLREVVVPLSAFGTAHESIDLPGGAALGTYWVEVRAHMQGDWRTVDRVAYRVAEYRPPEFLVDATPAALPVTPSGARGPHFPGDTFSVAVQARYLFGAPMGRAALTWHAQQTALYSWDLDIPNTDGWHVGESGSWWEESRANTMVIGSGVDTLDARGERTISLRLPEPAKGRAARATLQATVQDVNRQVVAASATTLLHPAEFYIAAKPLGASYFWTAGTPVTVAIKTVRPDGESVAGISIAGVVVRREWHRVRRVRDGIPEVVGDWVSDTVTRCSVTTATADATCAFTPRAGGVFTVSFTTVDSKGRRASTSFERWVAGRDWVPWNDESQFKMDVIPDRTRYSVGDTATILFASPFTGAEAWITVEREGIIEQRRLRITSGSTTLKFPITEAYSPNAFVSIVVARGRSAPPGPLDDPGRPTIRVGYAELRVTPEVKRLRVALWSDKPEYLPGDTARVSIEVRDARGSGGGPRAEVTLWAVDEGVLSLTGYRTPDPIDLIYKARGLGLRLASNMTSVAPQVPEGEKGRREPGGGGGGENADVLRSRFQTTAFFLGSVVTDANGNATASAKLPDNLTTFRLMAVAVTAGDRYGSGEAKLLVTRPLLARAALPRFVRGGDQLQAGAVINRRDGAAVPVTVKAAAAGVRLTGPAERSVTLDAGRGSEVRFGFNAPPGDSASFRFDVTDGTNADAVRVAIPVRPDHHPQTTVVAGVLRDTASVEMLLPSNIDPARSTLTLTIGGSPLASIRGMARDLRVYPYYCTEQLLSTAVPLIAMTRLQPANPPARSPLPDVARAVELLSRRQRMDGGIGYWSNTDWTSPWLSSYAGIVLLDARDVGVPVDSMVLERIAGYVTNALRDPNVLAQVTAVSRWLSRTDVSLGERVAAVDFLSRMNRPAIAMENELLRNAPQLSLEDRARLAEVMMRRGERPAALLLMVPTWAQVSVAGRTAEIPDSIGDLFYFRSEIRPLARILSATLALQPDHPLVGPLVEAVAQQGRAMGDWSWNTQDYASAVSALAAYDRLRAEHGNRAVRVRSNGRPVLSVTPSTRPVTPSASAVTPSAATGLQLIDSVIPLRGLLTRVQGGHALRLSLDAGPGDGAVYYYLTVNEIPATQPVTVEERGIRVERWYEDVRTRQPVQSVTEGDLVRVRLKVTVPATRSFVVVDDALPAGLEAVDLSLRGASMDPGPGLDAPPREDDAQPRWGFGRWDGGWWSAFDHREMRDDRVVYSATLLWPGSYTATYIARATTPGTFIKPPAHAEEMYNPGVHGRSEGGTFVVRPRRR